MIRNIRPDKINLLLTICGFIFQVGFYLTVMRSRPEPQPMVQEGMIEKQLTRIEDNYKTALEEIKQREYELTQELEEKKYQLHDEQQKVKELKEKISVNISTGWDELPEDQQEAYTEYAIQKIISP